MLIISSKKFMGKRKNSEVAVCSVDYAFQRIGGKYKGRILYQLRNGLQRYGQLRKTITGVTPKMLTQTLRELEEDGLLTRTVFLEVPPRVEYTLTENGSELIPFIALLDDWGKKQMDRRSIDDIRSPRSETNAG